MLKNKPKEPNAGRGDTLTFLVKKDVKAFLEEGKRHFDEGNISLAVETYGQALQSDPNCALVYFNLGFAHHELKDYGKAREYYLKAVDLEAECSLFLEHLGRLHFERGDYPSAISSFQKAITVGQVQPITYGLLGRAYFKSESYDKAADSLVMMLQLEGNPSLVNVARYHFILALLRLEDLFHSRKEAEILLHSEGCDHDILQNLGDEFSRQECISLAKRFFQRLETEDGGSVLARNTVDKIQGIETRIDEILPRLYESDEEKVLRSVHALMDVGHEKVARALLSLRHSDSALVRESVIEYMRKYGFDFSSQVFEMMTDPSMLVREKASHYLAEVRPLGYEEKLLAALQDQSAVVRRNLATYFARSGSGDALAALQEAFGGETSEEARESMEYAIREIEKREDQKALVAESKTSRGRKRFPFLRYGLFGVMGVGVVAGVVFGVFLQ